MERAQKKIADGLQPEGLDPLLSWVWPDEGGNNPYTLAGGVPWVWPGPPGGIQRMWILKCAPEGGVSLELILHAEICF